MALTATQVSSIKAGIAILSSGGDPERNGGDYKQLTPDARAGRYAFTSRQLEQTGYYKPGYADRYGQDCLYRKDVWTKKDGIINMRSFLNSAGVQEEAMQNLLSKNYKALISLGVMTENNPTSHIAGMLFVAHLLGVSDAVTWASTGIGTDSLGRKGTEWYSQGHYMIQNGIVYK